MLLIPPSADFINGGLVGAITGAASGLGIALKLIRGEIKSAFNQFIVDHQHPDKAVFVLKARGDDFERRILDLESRKAGH